MRIAVLMANTDESAFADEHPDDGQKFSELLRLARPDWQFDVYSVKDGVFPTSVDVLDGALITGSPASVHDDEAWISDLEALVRNLFTAEVPMFGACFGHQVIATALGGAVVENPGGWVMGAVSTQFGDNDDPVIMHAAHKEQVTSMPEGAVTVASAPGCAIAGFCMDDLVLTTQYHPEMSSDFVAALLEEYRDVVGEAVAEKGHASLAQQPDMQALADWICRFYESRQSHQ